MIRSIPFRKKGKVAIYMKRKNSIKAFLLV